MLKGSIASCGRDGMQGRRFLPHPLSCRTSPGKGEMGGFDVSLNSAALPPWHLLAPGTIRHFAMHCFCCVFSVGVIGRYFAAITFLRIGNLLFVVLLEKRYREGFRMPAGRVLSRGACRPASENLRWRKPRVG